MTSKQKAFPEIVREGTKIFAKTKKHLPTAKTMDKYYKLYWYYIFMHHFLTGYLY